MTERCASKDCDQVRGILSQFLDAIAEPVFVKDGNHRLQFVNEAYCHLLGYRAEDLVGKSEADVLSTGQAKAFLAAEQAIVTAGQPCEHQATITDRSGVEHIVLVRMSMFCAQGKSPMIVGTLRDITGQQKAEHILKRQTERERLFGVIAQHLLQSMNPEELLQTTVNEVRRFLKIDWAFFYSFDPDYRGVVAESSSDETLVLPGQLSLEALCFIPEDLGRYQRGEMQVIDDIASSHLAPTHLANLSQAGIHACLIMPIVQSDTLYGLICAFNRSSPRPWKSWEIETLREVSTQVGNAIKQARLYRQVQQLNADLEHQVTQRTQQLQTALEFEATLKRITDRVRDSLDVSQIMLTAVRELTEALNVKGSNTSLYDLEEGTSTIYYEYNSSIPSVQGRVAQMEAFPEVYHQLLDGQYFQFCSIEPHPLRGHVAMLACPILDDRGVLGDLWLINDRDYGYNDIEIRLVQQVANQCAIAIRQARLYQAAQSQVEELERLNHLKDDFLSTVSHELRTPVTSMRVALQLLGATLSQELNLTPDFDLPKAEQPRILRYYNILHEECEREISLINDLLDLQRLDVGNHPIQIEPVDLETWLPGLTESFMPRIKSREQTLVLDSDPYLPVVYTDQASLERILAELLNNACKYTPPGEQISLKTRVEPNDVPEQVVFVLTNTGVTIPANEQERVFDKFYRVPCADPWKQGGTGLGLALVKKLVMHLEGTIDLVSEHGETIFTITLPVQPRRNR
jgi:PAS domain S-box-containing protein